MRVVFDTNVILSAFLWQSGLKPIYDAIRTRAVIPCFSNTTWLELQRVLLYPKFNAQLSRVSINTETIIHLLSYRSYFVSSTPKVNVVATDPADNDILACAVAAQAMCIVSGDQHLLTLKIFQETLIITPRVFIETLLKEDLPDLKVRVKQVKTEFE